MRKKKAEQLSERTVARKMLQLYVTVGIIALMLHGETKKNKKINSNYFFV